MRKRVIVPACAIGLALVAAAGVAGGRADPDNQPASAKLAPWPECGTGPLEQMKSLAWMEGKWDMTITWYEPAPGTRSMAMPPTEAIIEPVFAGSFLQEKVTVPYGKINTALIGMRSFDRFRGVYRLVWFDDQATLADIYEGTPAQDGTIAMSNVKSGTSFKPDEKTESFGRITQRPGPDNDSFSLLWEVSNDGGKTWGRTSELKYMRKK